MKADVAELESLAAQATRQRVKDILYLEGRRLITEVIKLEEAQRTAAAETASGTHHIQNAAGIKRYQVKLNNYGERCVQ